MALGRLELRVDVGSVFGEVLFEFVDARLMRFLFLLEPIYLLDELQPFFLRLTDVASKRAHLVLKGRDQRLVGRRADLVLQLAQALPLTRREVLDLLDPNARLEHGAVELGNTLQLRIDLAPALVAFLGQTSELVLDLPEILIEFLKAAENGEGLLHVEGHGGGGEAGPRWRAGV